MAKKNVKVRDLKPTKDAKGGGGHTLSGGIHHPSGGASGTGGAHGAAGTHPAHGAQGGSPRGGAA